MRNCVVPRFEITIMRYHTFRAFEIVYCMYFLSYLKATICFMIFVYTILHFLQLLLFNCSFALFKVDIALARYRKSFYL